MSDKMIDNSLAKDTWEKIGEWWDDQMDEGDIFHSYLVHPNIIKLLALQKNDVVIDLACGNGALARKIAKIIDKPVYGVDFSSMYRLVADYVAKILNGQKAADLPIQQPTKFNTSINLKTAKAIGIELPTAILLCADEVIE